MKGKTHVVGVGPGSPECLTIKAKQVVKHSEIIAGYPHTLRTVKDLTHNKIVLELTHGNQEEILARVLEEAENGKPSSILCTEDPNFSDNEFIQRILSYLPNADIIPGISSIQVAAAKSQLAWDETLLLTFHVSGDLEKKKQSLLDGVRGGDILLL
ncbi:MAG: SAM-dependent methyltransferase, partial [Methanocellales archaeon]|nr:SAM-dependent methyltransferase [Methanocellales archaeon]